MTCADVMRFSENMEINSTEDTNLLRVLSLEYTYFGISSLEIVLV